MKQVVWKFVLDLVGGAQRVMVPGDAEILCAREQHGQVCIWVRCTPTAPRIARTIVIVGTGHPELTSDDRYLGTASLESGALMLHVFERT